VAGKYASQGKLPSEAQLVKRFHASRPTIARALRTLDEEQLIERRVGSGTFIRELSDQRVSEEMKEVALLIPDLGEKEIFQVIWGELATVARTHGYSVMWGAPAKPKREREEMIADGEELCEQFIQRRVSGVFFAPSHKLGDANVRFAEMLRKAGIPVVLLDKDLGSFPAHSDFDVASIDNVTAGHVMAEHLWNLGCRTFVFVTQADPASSVRARIAGVRESLNGHDRYPDARLTRFGDTSDIGFVKPLVSDLPDVLMCGNDETAATLLQTLAQLGVRVPRDVRVTGFDDVNVAHLVTPPLTTMQQPSREIAQIAFGAMLERQSNAGLPVRHLSIAPRLIIRQSCGTYG
jgi:DNA-binding LacI/PurR family transcriptional regulator